MRCQVKTNIIAAHFYKYSTTRTIKAKFYHSLIPDFFPFMHQVKNEKMTTAAGEGEAGLSVKPGLLQLEPVPPSVPRIPPTTHPTLPELKQPLAQPQGTFSQNVSVQLSHY